MKSDVSRIAVTGAAGFMGSWITHELLNRGHSVLALDDLSGGKRGNLGSDKNMLFEAIDLRDAAAVMREFESFKPEYVYHLAANAREGASFFQPISVTSRNIGAYTNVLTAGIKHGMRRIILFSSMAVYGEQEPPFKEDMPKKPVDVYGLAKAHMEDITTLLAGCHKFEYVIIRPHNVFGPRQALDDIHRNVIGIWMNKIMKGEPITIYGDGLQQRAFSYIENSLPCYIGAMTCKPNEIFNIGSDIPRSILDAALWTIEAMGKNCKNYEIVHLPDRHGEVKYAYSDHAKATRVLGLKETTGFFTGLRRMAIWAGSRGPQEWKSQDALEIPNQKTPEMWIMSASATGEGSPRR